jgi:hypothetical protein
MSSGGSALGLESIPVCYTIEITAFGHNFVLLQVLMILFSPSLYRYRPNSSAHKFQSTGPAVRQRTPSRHRHRFHHAHQSLRKLEDTRSAVIDPMLDNTAAAQPARV